MRLQNRALLVRLSIESWGITRGDESANRAVAAAKNSKESATHVGKRLAPPDALKPVKSKAEEARKYLRSVTQPWSDDGDRLLDAAALLNVQDELRRRYQPAWQAEVDQVIAKLPYFRDVWGPANLGDLYDPRNYPSVEQMRREFKWKLDVVPMNPDSKELRMVLGNDYVDQIQRETEERCRQDLAERIAAPLQNMVRRLSDPEGKFMDTLVSNVADVAALIPALNLTGDPRFDILQRQLEALTRHTPQTLRKSATARTETARQAQTILDRMSDFLPGAPDPAPAATPSADETLDLLPPPPVASSPLVVATTADLPLLAPVLPVPAPAVPAWRQRLTRR